MRFINFDGLQSGRLLVFPDVFLRWVPVDSIINGWYGKVLSYAPVTEHIWWHESHVESNRCDRNQSPNPRRQSFDSLSTWSDHRDLSKQRLNVKWTCVIVKWIELRSCTLTLLPWGIPDLPSFVGIVQIQTPNSFFFIGFASRSHPLKSPIRFAFSTPGAHSR